MGVENLEVPLQAAAPAKPQPELPPPLPYDGAVRNLYPSPPVQTPTHPEATPMHAYQPTVIDVPPQRKRGCLSYCAAPVNPRTYAVLMYFLLWNLPWAIFTCTWVNFTFWMSIGTVPLCLVGVVFLAIFSWTWRALAAVEVALINAICPPSSGRIERDELSFSPHLKNPVTWLCVPYFCMFKIVWAGMIFAFIGGLYALSIMFMLSPVYYWLGVGIECADCTGIWIVFVHLPAGCLLFWLTCVLTLLLGECEAQLIKALNQKKPRHHEYAAVGTSYTGYNEKTPMLTAAPISYAAYTPEKPTANQWVVPNTSLHLLVKNGSKGSRCCTAIGCTMCLAMTGFLFFLGITGIAAMHCGNVWGDSMDSVNVYEYDDKVGNNDWGAPIGIALDDSSDWWWNSWWGVVFNQGKIHVITDQDMDQSHVKYSVSVTNKITDNTKHALVNLVVPNVRNGILHIARSGQYSYWQRLRHCASFEVTMTVPAEPNWDYMPALRINGTNGFGVQAGLTSKVWSALSEVMIHTKNAYVNMWSPHFRPSDYKFENLPSLPVYIKTSNANIRLSTLLTSGTIDVITSNAHITSDALIGGGDSQITTKNGWIDIMQMYYPANFSSNWTITTKNDWIRIGGAYFTDSVYKNGLTVATVNSDLHLQTYGYYGNYDASTSKWQRAELNTMDYPGPINDKTVNQQYHKSGTFYKRHGYNPFGPTSNKLNDLSVTTKNDNIYWNWDSESSRWD